MKKTLSTYEITNELLADKNAKWSRAGAFALAEYLEDLEADTGEEMELDRVAIRCEFNEYEDAVEAALEYLSNEEFLHYSSSRDSLEGAALEYLKEHAIVILFDRGVIVSEF